MTTYHNIKELLAAHDADNFWRFGRNLYKYTDCGPWTRLVLTEERSMYYTDRGADDPSVLDDPDIIGIEIGSIVEGSDVEVGPYFLRFPFTEEQFEEAVKSVDDEAHFYWGRDNTDEYCVEHGGHSYWARIEPFEACDWGDDDVPVVVKETFDKWIEDSDLDEGESITIGEATITRIDKSDWIY